MIVFDEASKFPICVIKVATELSQDRINKEVTGLKALADLKLPFLKNAFPKVYFAGEVDGTQVLIQSFVEGRRMGEFSCTRKNPFWKLSFSKNMSIINDWLISFAKETKKNEKALSREDCRQITEQLSVSVSENEKAKGLLEQLINDLKGKVFFNVFERGDVHLDNILVRKDKTIAFIDWDLANPQGMPLWDLWDLSIFYARLILGGQKKGEDLANYINMAFFEGNQISKVINLNVKKYLRKLNIDIQTGKVLFALWQKARFKDNKLIEAAITNIDKLFL